LVHLSEADFKVHNPGAIRESTIWIDKARGVVVKRTEHSEPKATNAPFTRRVFTADVLTTYPIVDLAANEPTSTFTFTAPKDVVMVRDFGFGQPGLNLEWLMGKLAPDVRFRGPDGTIRTLSSLEGKPVFLDFWASWCGPCNSAVPDLLKLYAETAPKGLTWIGIDNDANPDAAEKFMKEKGIPWPNYHDVDGTIGSAFERSMVPLGVLLDSKGKVIFYKGGYQVGELRGAIATLGPEFNSVPPK